MFDNSPDSVSVSYTLSDYTKGSFEFMWGSDNSLKYSYITLSEGQLSTVEIAIVDGSFRYFDGIWRDTGVSVTNGNLYNHKIVFDCVDDTYDWYINGFLEVSDANFNSSSSLIDSFIVKTSNLHSDYSFYFDSITFYAYSQL